MKTVPGTWYPIWAEYTTRVLVLLFVKYLGRGIVDRVALHSFSKSGVGRDIGPLTVELKTNEKIYAPPPWHVTKKKTLHIHSTFPYGACPGQLS